jgi:hypothetical protein
LCGGPPPEHPQVFLRLVNTLVPTANRALLLFNVKSSRHGCGNRSAAGSYLKEQ